MKEAGGIGEKFAVSVTLESMVKLYGFSVVDHDPLAEVQLHPSRKYPRGPSESTVPGVAVTVTLVP